MTSLPIVPSKYYQVCRLCLTVVSDSNDLLNLSVFGSHNAACNRPAVIASSNNDNNNDTSNDNINSGSGGGSGSSSSGVIVKPNRKTEALNFSPTSEQKNTASTNDTCDNKVTTAATAAACGNDSGADGTIDEIHGTNAGDDDNNNFKIDGDSHQSDVLERIQTFLSITVSGQRAIDFFIFHIDISEFPLFFEEPKFLTLNANGT